MVYLYLMGGLGNQMFQYAYLRHFLKKYPDEKVVIDTSSYNTDQLRDFSLCHFEINQNWSYRDAQDEIKQTFRYRIIFRKILSRLIPGADKVDGDYEECTIPYTIKYSILNYFGIYRHNYSRYMKLKPSMFKTKFIAGMWHSRYIIDDVLEDVKKEFVLTDKLSGYNADFSERMRETNSVCVHVRRGDYLKLPQYWVCDFEYYKTAVNLAKRELDNPTFFFFSDDIEWVKEKFGSGEDYYYMEEKNPDYVDFAVMSSAKHFVISNSTYSWWASECGTYEGKRIYAPDRWYANDITKSCIYGRDWELIPTRVTR